MQWAHAVVFSFLVLLQGGLASWRGDGHLKSVRPQCLLSFATRTYPFGIDGLPTEKTKADAFKAEILEATLDAIADKVREYAPSRLTTCES